MTYLFTKRRLSFVCTSLSIVIVVLSLGLSIQSKHVSVTAHRVLQLVYGQIICAESSSYIAFCPVRVLSRHTRIPNVSERTLVIDDL